MYLAYIFGQNTSGGYCVTGTAIIITIYHLKKIALKPFIYKHYSIFAPSANFSFNSFIPAYQPQ
jgi:hypothetical protein